MNGVNGLLGSALSNVGLVRELKHVSRLWRKRMEVHASAKRLKLKSVRIKNAQVLKAFELYSWRYAFMT